MNRIVKVVGFLLAVSVLSIPATVLAQTAATAYISGTVYDPTQAVVPNATVEFRSPSTGIVRTVTSNAAGIFVVSEIPPGTYKVTASASGFRTAVISALKVDVAKSYTLNFNLEVGAMAETVEVTASLGIELQTTNATVGTAYGGEGLLRLPTANRSVASLLLYQPLVSPGTNDPGYGDVGGQVAGARSDQNTYLLDGGDATSNTEGTTGYNTGFDGTPLPMIPVPSESVEEFRVSTTNPNATFGRSEGGQVSIITKRGTNDLHGSAYWYHQNDNLNANEWDLNRTAEPGTPKTEAKPELVDNRYGFAVGGPVLKDRTWLFGHYEGRRFPRTETILRRVPTLNFRQGILIDGKTAYDFNPTQNFTVAQVNANIADPANQVTSVVNALVTGCGAAGNLPCDPRNLGFSSFMDAYFSLYPDPNDFNEGDGVNTAGFRFPVDNTLDEDFFVVRFDQKITDKWNGFASYRYSSTRRVGTQQVDISGTTCSGVQACTTRKNPLEPRYLVGGITGQITPTLTSETRASWFRHWWEWSTTAPFSFVTGVANALDVGGESRIGTISELINIDTQNGRARTWNGKDTFVAQNMTWVKGKHTVQFGGTFRRQDIFHQRTDKVLGGLTTGEINYIGRSLSRTTIPASSQPPAFESVSSTRWNLLYTNLMGMVERVTHIATRDGQFNPEGFTGAVRARVDIYAVEFYAQDVWRMTPDFTVTYGLTYQVQRPPVEREGRQVVQVFADTGEPISIWPYFRLRREAASRGEIFNPTIGYAPIGAVPGQKYITDIDWNNLGPRVALAWSPASEGWLLGNRKTVLRAGYSQTFTRMNGVGLVMTPILGVGLAEAIACQGPDRNGRCRFDPLYAGVDTNADGVPDKNDPATAFRIGQDGSDINLPAQGAAQIPFRGIGETLSFSVDPGMKLGVAHSLDLTYQRELPRDFLLEVGYVGRLGRNLTQGVDLNSTPYFQLDPTRKSSQTYAEAFNAVATQLRAGVPAASVTPQPFFENVVGAGGTRSTAADCKTEFLVGDMAFVELNCGLGLANEQIGLFNQFTTDHGRSYYHAGFVSLRHRMAGGWTMDANYTYGHSIDTLGLNQENVFGAISPFDLNFDRASSLWDRRHTFNFTSFYELPFGRGKRWSAENNVADKIIGGWFISGIFTAYSGLPLCVAHQNIDNANGDGGNFGGTLGLLCAIGRGPSTSAHKGVTGSNKIGTGGDVNIFADPESVFNSFRFAEAGRDFRTGFGHVRGLPRWNVDFSLGKKTSINERVSVAFSFDFINAFNHLELEDPDSESLSLDEQAQFGVLDDPLRLPRFIQFGIRIEF